MTSSEPTYNPSSRRASDREAAEYTTAVKDLLDHDPAPDWEVDGRPVWGGYCGDQAQLWWCEPGTAGVSWVELEILGGIEDLSAGGHGLLLDVRGARELAGRLLAAAAVAAAAEAQMPSLGAAAQERAAEEEAAQEEGSSWGA